jgi:hypothetical protein
MSWFNSRLDSTSSSSSSSSAVAVVAVAVAAAAAAAACTFAPADYAACCSSLHAGMPDSTVPLCMLIAAAGDRRSHSNQLLVHISYHGSCASCAAWTQLLLFLYLLPRPLLAGQGAAHQVVGRPAQAVVSSKRLCHASSAVATCCRLQAVATSGDLSLLQQVLCNICAVVCWTGRWSRQQQYQNSWTALAAAAHFHVHACAVCLREGSGSG